MTAARKHDYAKDLAYVHHVGFGGFSRQAAPALLKLLARVGIETGLVVDLGCGSGIWAGELCRAGYEVLGVDYSAEMLKLARRQAPRARFRRESYLRTELPTCSAVTSLGECLCYLFDQHHGPAALAKLLRRVFAALRPGGVLIFDALEPGYGKRLEKRRYFTGDDWATLVEVEEDEGQRVFTRRITTFRQVGRLYRRSLETHRLWLYSRHELTSMLRREGFKVRLLAGYGDLKFRPAHVGYLARKPLR